MAWFRCPWLWVDVFGGCWALGGLVAGGVVLLLSGRWFPAPAGFCVGDGRGLVSRLAFGCFLALHEQFKPDALGGFSHLVGCWWALEGSGSVRSG